MQSASSSLWRAGLRAAIGLAVFVLLPYAWGPIYSFPAAEPFIGSSFWNPYSALTGTWQRANLHAHGRAWGGLTSGAQPDSEVVARYRELGYSVAGVSNYQSIAAHHGIPTLPLYEHGFNAGKNHQLAIGAHAVDWFDFPLWQTLNNQQYVIDRVGRKADLVSLNHPSSRSAYDDKALRSLTGYQLIEVVNGPFTVEAAWDAALSAGRPVFALANDDTHDLRDERRAAIGWNMIDARSTSTDDIVSALRAGRSYAVLRTGSLATANHTRLASLIVADGTIRVALEGAPSTITFVGRDGSIRHSANTVTTAEYPLRADDTYVRTVVTGPDSVLYLNPVIRWNGRSLPEPRAGVNAAATWTQRGGILVACALLAMRLRGRREQPALRSAAPLTRRA